MRNIVQRSVFVLFAVGAAAGLATAQQSSTATKRPPAEVTLSAGKLYPIYFDFFTDDVDELGGDVRVTLPFTPRFAFEGAGTIGRRQNDYSSRVEGFYIMQIKQRLIRAERGAFRPFLTYGVAGYYSHFSRPELHLPGPNGSLMTYPAYSQFEHDPPLATLFGGGFQQRLSNRLALRADVQMMTLLYLPLGSRYSVGLSVALGPGYSMN
jgi:hypothetical protein